MNKQLRYFTNLLVLMWCSTSMIHCKKEPPPAPFLTYAEQTISFSDATGFPKTLAMAKILAGVQGSGKEGYTIKSIALVSTTASATVSGTQLTFAKPGIIVFHLVLKHANWGDVTIKNCKIIISKDAAATLTFNKVYKAFISGGSFTPSEILAGVAGTKLGYTLKEIKTLAPSDVASVTGTKPNLSLRMTKIGSFTATIVLEHSTKGDATIKGAEFKINSSPGERLTFDKLTKVYSIGGRFTTAEILGRVGGTKAGYTLREMRSLNPIGVAGVTGTKPNLSLTMTKAGNFTATLVLAHATKGDSTIDNASFEITKASAPTLTWTKQSKPYGSGGEISNAELLAGLNGTTAAKTGYTIKSVTISSANGTGARVSGSGRAAKITSYTKMGTLTLTIVFEHSAKVDVTLTGKEFEITKGRAASLTWTKQTKAFRNYGEITHAQLLAGVTGSGKTGYTIKTVRITNINGTGARVSGSGRAAKITSYTKAGTLTLTIVLEHHTKEDVTLRKAEFHIYRDIFTISSSGEVKLQSHIYKNSLTTVTIPYMIRGTTVTSIENYGFYQLENVTSITIPNSVTSIGHYAFNGCSKLTSITIPNSVTSIGNQAFTDCHSLTSITIPNSVTSIGRAVFYGCGLTSITLPNSVTSIGHGAFAYCRSLTSITIPNSVTSIGGGAFSGCRSLTSVTIPNSVTIIERWIFRGCTSLTTIELPNSITSIGYNAFQGCSSLTSITIPNSVTSIGYNAFQGCSSLTSITIPNSVTIIERMVFYGCSKLTSITMGNSVTSIGSETFRGCTSLTRITIPNSVTSIGEQAFQGCRSLTSITMGNSVTSIGEQAFQGCSSLTRITIPNSVTSIGEQAFWGCRSLTNITMGNSVTSIGSETFRDCTSLTRITIPNSVTSIGNQPFAGCSKLTTILVPSAKVSTWQANLKKGNFASVVGY